MTDDASDDVGADVGLLSPIWAGTPVALTTSDRSIVGAMLDVELALVAAIAPVPVVEIVRSVRQGTRFDVADIAVRARGGGNPVIPLVADLRAAVAAVDADAAGWVHRGATSQDILDTALILMTRRALELVLADAQAVARSLAALADRHRATLMVARTLTQHSVPTTFGLTVAGWLHGVVRAARRLVEARGQLPLQWGGAGGTLASYADDGLSIGTAMAHRLDLVAPIIPWQVHRAPITEIGDAITQLTDALGKIAVDVLLLSRPEIAELREPAAVGRGVSSAMPQKQNPVLSMLINTAARRSPSLAAELHRSAVAVNERPDGAWHVEWPTLRELLRLAGGATGLAAELVGGLLVREAAMLANLKLSGPLIVSERLMLEFGPLIGRTKLQQLISVAVGDATVDLAVSLRAEPGLAGISDERLARLLEPANYLGVADELVTRVLDDLAENGLGVQQ